MDVCGVLTDQPDTERARNYWKVLKHRLVKEGNQPVTNCNRLKLRASDGKLRLTDVADTEQLFRIIQSIPSPKAEPFKVWMAQVASTRLEQMQDPEKDIGQAVIATLCQLKAQQKSSNTLKVHMPHNNGTALA